MSTSLYKQALKLITMNDIDYEGLAVHYAQNHPASFVSFFREANGLKSFSTDDIVTLYGHINAGEKVDAITYHRTITGSSFKEAKDVIDSLEKQVQRRN